MKHSLPICGARIIHSFVFRRSIVTLGWHVPSAFLEAGYPVFQREEILALRCIGIALRGSGDDGLSLARTAS
jgi:hypothetical protein